jgi:hypothetical protein
MSKIIEKKILSPYFERLLDGSKTFELRLADWECKEGDTLVLNEIDPTSKQPTGRSIKKRVGYILKTSEFDAFPKEEVERYGYQVISLLPEDAA